MNLPTTAKNLKPEEWQRVMRLIHPDNVEETLRILHAHEPMVRVLRALMDGLMLGIEAEVATLLGREPARTKPWPPEPQPEQEASEPAQA